MEWIYGGVATRHKYLRACCILHAACCATLLLPASHRQASPTLRPQSCDCGPFSTSVALQKGSNDRMLTTLCLYDRLTAQKRVQDV